jgi:cardiolipin synthase
MLESYFVESGSINTQFVHALVKAVNRGVEVLVLFDDIGSRNLNESDRNLLIKQGVNLCFYHPMRFCAFFKITPFFNTSCQTRC